MSATGLEVFDKTLQTTNIWLDEIMQDIGPDRKTAWRVLAVVLHRLRNRLTIGLAVNLGAQLPILVRGVYYDQFQPEQLPGECNTFEEFCAEVAEWLQDNRPVDPELAVKSVFRVLSRHVSGGEIANVVQALPKELRQAWPESARTSAGQGQSPADQPGSAGSEGFIGKQSRTSEEKERDFEPGSSRPER